MALKQDPKGGDHSMTVAFLTAEVLIPEIPEIEAEVTPA